MRVKDILEKKINKKVRLNVWSKYKVSIAITNHKTRAQTQNSEAQIT